MKCRAKLISDFEEMKLLSRRVHSIRFTTRGDPPSLYFVDMDFHYIVVDWRKRFRRAKNLKFSIKLPKAYPKTPPEFTAVKGFGTPYHPHFSCPSCLGLFKSFFREGSWVDYRPHDSHEGLGAFVLRIARSLQFDPDYICTNQPICRIGNISALKWYQKKMAQQPCSFPVGKVRLPKRLDEKNTDEAYDFAGQNRNDTTSSALTTNHRTLNESQKKFEITEQSPPHKPETKSVSDLNFDIVGKSTAEHGGFCDKNHVLYVHEKAADNIMHQIDWSKNTKRNRVEQGGLLLGNVYVDTGSGHTYGVVERIVAGEYAVGSGTYLEMTFETWKAMLDEVDDESAVAAPSELHVIGWFHTHPDNLDVFMSDTDKLTQSRFFNQDWHFAIVLNPQKMIWRVYFGKYSMACKGYVTRYRQMKEQ